MYISHVKRTRSKVWLILAATFALVTIGSMSRVMADDGTANHEQHMITIYDEGVEQTIITRADTVRDALKQAEVTVANVDMVEPRLDQKLVAEHYNVNIYRARPVIVEDGQTRLRTVTAAQSPSKIAEAADVTLYPEDTTTLKRVDDVIGEGGAGLKLSIDRATPFSFVLYGKRLDETRTQATTVGEMLKEKKVKLGPKDGTSLPLSTSIVAGMTVEVWRNGVQTLTLEEAVAMPVEQVKDQDREVGFREVRTVGKPGKKQVTYEIDTQNGKEVSRKVIQEVETLAPVKQVEVIGAKFRGAYTTPSENEIITWDFLISQGFSRNQTAGIMGNLKQEHGFNTTGDGLAQWTGGRKAALMSRNDPYNIYTQLDFMMYELNGSYSRVQASIRSSGGVEQAVKAFQDGYEGCGICAESRRVQYAYDILVSH